MDNGRRKFLNIIIAGGIAGWVASVIYPVISYLKPPKIPEAQVNSVKGGTVSDFPPNSGQIIQFGRIPVILIRTVDGKFKAFEATCTHLDCIVQYRTDTHRIWCACHNGVYDLNGRNISGPPPKPLTQYNVNISDDEIFITKA
ncbi:MAG: Rieske (2Fe-2S) protein [Calditrichia bacterium]